MYAATSRSSRHLDQGRIAPPGPALTTCAFWDDPEPPLPPDANVEALETYLRGIFARVDTSGDGAISVSEAAAALRDDDEFAEVLGVSDVDDVFAAIDALDEDGDQRVSWSEFRGAVLGATPWGAE